MPKLRAISQVRLRDFRPRFYAEWTEGLEMRVGIEVVPQGEALWGLELLHTLTERQNDWLMPRWDRWRERWKWVD